MPTENNNTFKFSVTAETALTKTNLGENSDGTYSLTWTKGDKIGLFVADRQANCKLAFADGKFSGELVAGKPSASSVNYLAYYPYSSTSGDGYMVSNEIANIQYMPFDGTSDFMYTDVVANPYDERNMPTDMKLAFAHHLFGIVNVNVNVNSTDEALKDEKILSVTLSSESTVLSGAYTFDLANTGVAPKFDAHRSYKNVTSEYRDPQALVGRSHVFQFVANSFTDVSDLTLTVKTTHYTFTKKAGAAVSLKAGEVTVLPAVTISGTGEKRKKVLSYFGDSIACKALQDYLQGLLGEDWVVYMNGIPGAGDLNVAGAVGCVDLTFDKSFTLPADGKEVECGKISALENLNGVKGMYNVLSTYWFTGPLVLNPITVYTDEDAVGIECELRCEFDVVDNKRVNAKYFLKRVNPTDQATEIKAGKSRVKTYQATHLRDADVLCIYTGTNNSFRASDYEAVVNIHKRMRDFMTGPAKEDYIICGFHTNRYVGLHRMWTKEYAEIMENAFGKEHMLDYKLLGLDIDKNHVPVPSGFNADATFPNTDTATEAEKQAYYEKALNLSLKVGARDFGTKEIDGNKAKDRANVAVFEWPTSWWGNYDNNVHPNKEGYNVMANLVYEKMKTLGYLN